MWKPKRITDKNKKDLGLFIVWTAFIAATMMAYTGAADYWAGMHDVDLAWNYERIKDMVDPYLDHHNVSLPGSDEAMDMNSDFVQRTLTEGYIRGSNRQKQGIDKLFFAGLFFAAASMGLVSIVNHNWTKGWNG